MPNPTTMITGLIREHSFPVAPCREHRPHKSSLHTAVIMKRGKVIATATNRIGTRSRGSGYSDQMIHAEKAVVKKLGDISKLKDSVLCVWRLSSINILPSKPCEECQLFLQKCMREYGLKAVYYTDSICPL